MLITRRAVKGLKLIFKYSFFTGEDEAFPSLLRYGKRRRDTVVLIFFSIVSITKYMLFSVFV